MRKFLYIVIVILISIDTTAYDFKKGRIYYKILSKKDSTVSVDAGKDPYMYALIVPSTVTYKNKLWKVVSIEKNAFQRSPRLRYLQVPFTDTLGMAKVEFPKSSYLKLYVAIPHGTNNLYFKSSVLKGVGLWGETFSDVNDEILNGLKDRMDNVVGNQLPAPKIKLGSVNISCKINNYKQNDSTKVYFSVLVYDLLSSESHEYKSELNSENRFQLNVPLSLDKQLIEWKITEGSKMLSYSYAIANQDTTMTLFFDYDNHHIVNTRISGDIPLTSDEVYFLKNYDDRTNFLADLVQVIYNQNQNELIENQQDLLKTKIDMVTYPYHMTSRMQDYISKYFFLKNSPGYLFNYSDMIAKNKTKFYNPKNPLAPDTIKIVKEDKSYYSFLRNYSLNDPVFLYCYSGGDGFDFLKSILSTKALEILQIGDTPVEEWLKNIKGSMGGVIGFSDGLFYDLLVAAAYSEQMNDSLKELNVIQKNNILAYFQDKERDLATLLFNVSDHVVNKLPYAKRLVPYTIDSIHGVSPEHIIESIAAKHYGRVTLIDIWATWCSPCMNAHTEMRAVKDSLRKAGVDFVYISDTSSPRKEWEEDIKYIGDEHYYLDHKDVSLILEKYKLMGFPSYFIFDKEGNMCNCFCGFKGVEDMLERLNHANSNY